MLRILILLLLISNVNAVAQKFQGALRIGYAKTFYHETNESVYDKASFSIRSLYGPAIGINLNYSISPYLDLSSGLGIQVKKFQMRHEPIDFPGLTSGNNYLTARISSSELPLILVYKIPLNSDYRLCPKVGIAATHMKLKTTILGYEEYRYEGTDSLFYDITGGGSFTGRFSAEPGIGLSVMKSIKGERIFEIGTWYQYSLIKPATMHYNSSMQNNNERRTYSAVLSPYLSYASLSFIYYPTWLMFRKAAPEDDGYFEDQE